MSNIEQVQQVSNSPILWLLCGVTVVISAIQTVLYMRQCSKTTRAAGLDPKIPKEAFRVGLISAIGPALGVFIVMVGLMASIGGPMAWLRLSIIGAAATELSAANIGAEACGVTLGTEQYTLNLSCGFMVYHGLKRRRLASLYRCCHSVFRDAAQ